MLGVWFLVAKCHTIKFYISLIWFRAKVKLQAKIKCIRKEFRVLRNLTTFIIHQSCSRHNWCTSGAFDFSADVVVCKWKSKYATELNRQPAWYPLAPCRNLKVLLSDSHVSARPLSNEMGVQVLGRALWGTGRKVHSEELLQQRAVKNMWLKGRTRISLSDSVEILKCYEGGGGKRRRRNGERYHTPRVVTWELL